MKGSFKCLRRALSIFRSIFGICLRYKKKGRWILTSGRFGDVAMIVFRCGLEHRLRRVRPHNENWNSTLSGCGAAGSASMERGGTGAWGSQTDRGKISLCDGSVEPGRNRPRMQVEPIAVLPHLVGLAIR